MMQTGKVENFQGNKFEILEMILKNVDDQIELSLKICFENAVFWIIFSNVSRFRIGEVSMPLAIHGFEIINHSQDGWEKDSIYEIRDFEDDCIHFFCESFEIKE